MIENSTISQRSVYESFSKFQRTASDHRFRTRSYRVKTVEHEIEAHLVHKIGLPLIVRNQSSGRVNGGHEADRKGEAVKDRPRDFSSRAAQGARLKSCKVLPSCKVLQNCKIMEKNYESELGVLGLEGEFLRQVFMKKCEQSQTHYQEHKFQAFMRNLYHRLTNSKTLTVHQMGLAGPALSLFLGWLASSKPTLTALDLSLAHQLLRQDKMECLRTLLRQGGLLGLSLQNSSLEGTEVREVLELVGQGQQLFSLNLSNLNSQDLNRMDLGSIQNFCRRNASVGVLALGNLHLRKDGLQHIARGIGSRKDSPLRILALPDNHIQGEKACEPFVHLLRSGLTHLDLSRNPLGHEFYDALPSIKSGSIKQLDLSETGMSSQNLYCLLQKVQECKSLVGLKADRNDLSHHWFGKVGEKLEVNSSLEQLSLNECQIRSFLPFFEGLLHNKYLRRLEASHNLVDSQQEVKTKIVDFFTHNKFLEQVRFRFCCLSQQVLVSICEGLSRNRRLRVLDISENAMQDLAASSILKMLEQNLVLEELGIDKLQLSQQMKRRVQLKLQENASLREQESLTQLAQQTQEARARDVCSWDDLHAYEQEERRLAALLAKTQDKNHKLEEMLSKKKQALAVLVKKHRDEEVYLERTIQDKLRISNEAVHSAQANNERLGHAEQELQQLLTQERQRLQQLQSQINIANLHNKRRENQLEDKLRNHRYLQRKQSKSKQIVEVSGRKYSSHHHQHGR